jgi:hypothetical protein
VTAMDVLVERIAAAQVKRLLGWKPLFRRYKPATAPELAAVERSLDCILPASLKDWLLKAGYGDFNEELSLREAWFSVIDRGELQGHVLFGQDDCGNFYAADPGSGGIHFVCRSAPEYACMADDFRSFLEELERRKFRLQPWVESLTTQPYAWGP